MHTPGTRVEGTVGESPQVVGDRHVLLVDDQWDVGESLAALLRVLGCRVTVAASGAQAVKVLRHAPVHLVLTDVRMPDMSGWGVLEAAQRHAPGVPVILMTGFDGYVSPTEALRRGAVAVCTKPLGLRDLSRLLKRFTA